MQPLSNQTQRISAPGSSSVERVRVTTPTIFELCVTFDMIGADWDFVNALHNAYEYEHNWPDGMLCHITSETAEGVHSQGIWTNPETEAAYFRNVVVNVITQAMADLGPAAGQYGAVDFEPVSRSIEQLIIGPLLEEFSDIGPDHDAKAIHTLGTDPVALQTSFAGVKAAELADASRSLGLRTVAPEGLLLLVDESDDSGVPHQTQVWRSVDEAFTFWGESFAPALVDVGAVASETGMPKPEFRSLKRISVGSKQLEAAWRR